MEDEAYTPTEPNQHSDIECRYWFDAEKTKPIFKHNQTDMTVALDVLNGNAPSYVDPNQEHYMGFQGTIVYVKKGTPIYASASYYTDTHGTAHIFRFYEYKIQSLNP